MTFCGGGAARGGARGLFAFGLHPTSSLPPSRFVDFQRRGSVHSVLSVDDTFNDSASSHFSSARNDAVFPSVPEIDKRGTTSTYPGTDDDEDNSTGLMERDDRLDLDDYHSYATPDSSTRSRFFVVVDPPAPLNFLHT